nr:hypothetical protein [Tanacetum cinerariifolium]
NNLGLSDKY